MKVLDYRLSKIEKKNQNLVIKVIGTDLNIS